MFVQSGNTWLSICLRLSVYIILLTLPLFLTCFISKIFFVYILVQTSCNSYNLILYSINYVYHFECGYFNLFISKGIFDYFLHRLSYICPCNCFVDFYIQKSPRNLREEFFYFRMKLISEYMEVQKHINKYNNDKESYGYHSCPSFQKCIYRTRFVFWKKCFGFCSCYRSEAFLLTFLKQNHRYYGDCKYYQYNTECNFQTTQF